MTVSQWDTGNDHAIIYFSRIGFQKEFNRQWLESDLGYLDGYLEVAYNRWDREGESIDNLAITPMFRYVFSRISSGIIPFVYGSIGLSYGDGTDIGPRDLSSKFLFEENLVG